MSDTTLQTGNEGAETIERHRADKTRAAAGAQCLSVKQSWLAPNQHRLSPRTLPSPSIRNLFQEVYHLLGYLDAEAGAAHQRSL